jgi:hypothetical protein
MMARDAANLFTQCHNFLNNCIGLSFNTRLELNIPARVTKTANASGAINHSI